MILWIEVDGKNPEIQLSFKYPPPTDKAIVIVEVNKGIIKYETIANLD